MYSTGSFVFGLLATGTVLWMHVARRSVEEPMDFLMSAVAGGLVFIVFSVFGAVLAAAGLYLGDSRRWAIAGLALSLWPWALLVLAVAVNSFA
jgi:zinc transporter ZupT